jgi:hypothetical protein
MMVAMNGVRILDNGEPMIGVTTALVEEIRAVGQRVVANLVVW